MSHGNEKIEIISVINPCLYVVVFPDSLEHSLVGLYGIIPPELKAASNFHPQEIVLILNQWRNNNLHIKELFSSADEIKFEPECVVDGVPFGKFTVITSQKLLDLKDYLLKTTIGALSDNSSKDALTIKANSWRPEDFSSSSLSSSDESCSTSLRDKRKLKTRSTCLKKPPPLTNLKSPSNFLRPSLQEPSVSKVSHSIVRALLEKQVVPLEFVQRYSVAPRPELFLFSPKPLNLPKNDEATAVKYQSLPELEHYLASGENEVSQNYAEVQKEWIKEIANEHLNSNTRSMKISNSECDNMPSTQSSVSSDSTVKPVLPVIGRGKLLSMLQQGTVQSGNITNESESSNNNSILSNTASNKGMGRGQYLQASGHGLLKAFGRGQRLRVLLNQTESGSKLSFEPDNMKRVFSLDVFEGARRTTIKEDTVDVESNLPLRQKINDKSDLSSSTSLESLNHLHIGDQSLSVGSNQPEALNTSDVDLSNNSNTSLNSEQTCGYLQPEILSDVPIDEYMKRILAFAGLVHGNNCIAPVNCYTEANLHPIVVEKLQQLHVRDLMRSQSYAIPNILKRRNAVLIGAPRSGKTSAAIIPLVSLLGENEFYAKLKPGCGPRAVYITSFAQKVDAVAARMNNILPSLSIVNTHGGGNELEKKEKLVNGCDVIVSTPKCFLRLLKYKWVTSANRLCHLYLDDFDSMISLFKPEFMNILSIFDQIKSKRAGVGPEPQLVLIGESWNPIISDILLTRMPDPLLCCTSFLEASLYTHIRPTVHILSNSNKINKLFELLDSRDKVPTVIVCNDSDEVLFLRNLLYTRRNKVLISHDNMVFSLKRDAHVNWQNLVKSKTTPLMITCDCALNDLGINNAKWLIHYSLPLSKTNFDYRFSTIKSYFIDRLKNPKALLTPECFVDILVDHDNEKQLPDVVSFMQRLNTQVPQEILSAVEKICKKKEASKSSEVGLCQNILKFGNCWRQSKCKQQHCINYDRDKPRNIPLSGYVKIKLLKVHSATHFSARLIAHSEEALISSDRWTNLPSSFSTLALHLNRYYADRSNRRIHGHVQVGDLAGVEVDVDINYLRVKVLQILKKDERHNPLEVRVHFIDEGTIADLKVFKLLHLSNELRTYPRASVDLYHVGLLPVDFDRSWSFSSTNLVRKKLDSIPDNYSLVAKVCFVFGFTIIVESIRAIETLDISKCTVAHFSLRKYLLERNLAVENRDHLVSLIQLCQEANFPVSARLPEVNVKYKNKARVNSKKLNEVTSAVSSVKWAHLPKDEISTVILSCANDLSSVYVNLEKFNPLLGCLEKDILKHMEKNPKLINIGDLTSHLICLAKYEDRWNRGLLCEDAPQSNDSGDLIYPVLFVDYGDKMYLPATEIAPCPDKFISSLPFQAIKCELVGLNPLNCDRSDEVVDLLYEMTKIIVNDESIFKPISLIVSGMVCDSPSINSGKHYKVILIDSTSGKDVVINKEIVYRGFANWNPLEKNILDTLDTSNLKQDITQENEDESDTIFDECKEDDSNFDSEKHLSEDDNHEYSNLNDKKLLDLLENYDIQLSANEDSPLYFLANLQKNCLSKMGKKPSTDTSNLHINTQKTVTLTKRIVDSDNDADISELEDSKNVNITSAEFHIKSGFFTPKTGWLQTSSYVYIRIMIPGVEKYSLSWSSNFFDFSASYDGKRYRLYVDLFGCINPERVFHSCKGLYFEMKMLKLLTDNKWPRLIYDECEKPIWLQLLNEPDLKDEDLTESVSTQVNFGEMSAQQGKKDIIEFDEEVIHYDRDDDASDGSDIELEIRNNDPYDPLS